MAASAKAPPPPPLSCMLQAWAEEGGRGRVGGGWGGSDINEQFTHICQAILQSIFNFFHLRLNPVFWIDKILGLPVISWTNYIMIVHQAKFIGAYIFPLPQYWFNNPGCALKFWVKFATMFTAQNNAQKSLKLMNFAGLQITVGHRRSKFANVRWNRHLGLTFCPANFVVATFDYIIYK